MTESTAFVLRGYGSLETSWVAGCLQLFKQSQVNIRRLTFLQQPLPNPPGSLAASPDSPAEKPCSGAPTDSTLALLEIHFLLSVETPQPLSSPRNDKPFSSLPVSHRAHPGEPSLSTHPFLDTLEQMLQRQTWHNRELQAIGPVG